MLFLLSLLGLAFAEKSLVAQNGCVTFQLAPGTGCAWMCSYCSSKLGPTYYFTDGVCTYEVSGCEGNPQAGVSYTCCAAGSSDEY